MNEVKILIRAEEGASAPYYATEGAAGADIKAYLKEDLSVEPGHSVLVPTGLYFEIPEGYEIQIRPRSGLAFKQQITVLNTPGTVDSDYRGELKVILINHGKKPFVIAPNMRIAQLVVASVTKGQFLVVNSELTETTRGEGSFGHTGKY
ncbi:MAG: Deoxyuridine 5'-triphosphate nucleotidohydrolase [Chlamydiae bacterium]|nr:Deoxyuridine 5'-triphosphate nucleotidohydrolase [Chlamydiota bacterium]